LRHGQLQFGAQDVQHMGDARKAADRQRMHLRPPHQHRLSPSASALAISVPERSPPSTSSGKSGPTASRTGARRSSAEGMPGSTRPP
jgi:hypothetical protein